MLHDSLQTKASELAPTPGGSAVSLHAFFLGRAVGPAVFGADLSLAGVASALAIQAVTMTAAGFASAGLLQRADRREPRPTG